nr:hypothetical protein [Bacteroidota bacterium]
MTKSTTIKILKIAGIIIGVVLIVVLAILFYLDRNAGSIAENQLKEAFAKSPLSQVYELNYKAIDIGLFSGNVKISDLTLTPNPMIYTADDTLKSRYLTLLDLVIDKVIVKGFDTESGLSIKNIELASIVIRRPEVKVIEYLSKEEKNRLKRLFPKQPKEPDSVVKSPGVQGVKIGKFIVENGKFDLYDYASNTSTLTAGKFSLSADSLRIHTTDILQTILGKTFNRFYVSCKELKYPLKNGFYTVE